MRLMQTCTASRVDFTKSMGEGIEFEFEKNEELAVPRLVCVDAGHALDLSALAT